MIRIKPIQKEKKWAVFNFASFRRKKMNTDNDREREILKSYHISLGNYMRQRESNTFQFLGTLISALGTFGWAITKDFSDSRILLLVSFICILILYWGIFVALCFSYYHRCFQKVMSKIEKEKLLISNILPPDWYMDESKNKSENKSKKSSIWDFWHFYPEVYKVHTVFLFMGILVILGTVLKSTACILQKGLLTLIVSFGLGIYICCSKHYLGKLETLYQEKMETPQKIQTWLRVICFGMKNRKK
jgi:hypothetical protein